MLHATAASEAGMVIRWRLSRCLRILEAVMKKQRPGELDDNWKKVRARQPPFKVMNTAFLLQPLLSEFDSAGI